LLISISAEIKMVELNIKGPSSRFVKVGCSKCKNEQIIFGKAITKVDCLVCGELLAESSGGKSRINGKVIEVLN